MTSDLMLAIKTIIIVSPNWRKVLKLFSQTEVQLSHTAQVAIDSASLALRSPKISREHTRMPAYHCHYNTGYTAAHIPPLVTYLDGGRHRVDFAFILHDRITQGANHHPDRPARVPLQPDDLIGTVNKQFIS